MELLRDLGSIENAGRWILSDGYINYLTAFMANDVVIGECPTPTFLIHLLQAAAQPKLSLPLSVPL